MSLCFHLCSRFRKFSAASLSGYSVSIYCLYQMLGIRFMAGCLTHISLAIQCPMVWLPDVPELDMIPGSCS